MANPLAGFGVGLSLVPSHAPPSHSDLKPGANSVTLDQRIATPFAQSPPEATSTLVCCNWSRTGV
jgi:hypothetical protein